MLEAALAGAIAGYAIAVPVGAIAVLIIHIGLTADSATASRRRRAPPRRTASTPRSRWWPASD